jgi:hypothetical protein
MDGINDLGEDENTLTLVWTHPYSEKDGLDSTDWRGFGGV